MTVVSYQLFWTNSANKAQTKLDKPLRLKIKDALLRIAGNPTHQGEKLSQPLSMVYSHHLKYKGKEFRIAYQTCDEKQVVIILLIAPHENFYKRVKQLVYAS